jgi:hypothetical protein
VLTCTVVAGLVPATPMLRAQRETNRGGRDKPGHDSVEGCRRENQMSYDDLARNVALRLQGELDRNLPAAVEAQIHGGGAAPKRFDAGITIALAALILSAAQFAWKVYRDIKKDSKTAPAPEVIARRMRLELNIGEEIDGKRRDRIIDVVVDELVKRPPEA